MKKYYSLGIVLITWLMSMTVTKVFAYDIAVEINDSVAIYYNYIHDGTELEVTFQNDKWYNSYSDTIVIPEEVTYMDKTLKVTSIGDWAFYSSKGLSSVTIPGSVERIGNYAFYECDSLVSVTIPNSVRYIGMVAFDSCKSLTTISIPNGITSIEFGTFRDCKSITSITIPDSVTTIGGDAFAGCSSLNTIKIGNSVTSIGNDAFLGCGNLTSVHISDIAAWYKINYANLSSTPMRYAHQLYINGEELNSLIVPDGITSIGKYAFLNCSSLNDITIPNSITSIGDGAFQGCDQLLSVTSEIEAPFNCNILFSENTYRNGTLYVPAGTKELYTRFDSWRNFLNIVEMDDGNEPLDLTLQDGAHGKLRMTVKQGESYTFKIEPEDGWEVHKIIYNDTDVTGELDEQNQFTTPKITGNAVLNVVYEQVELNVRKLEMDHLNVFPLSDGRVQIEGAKAGMECNVYTLDGMSVNQFTITSDPITIQLPRDNTYLIRVGTKTLKVRVI